MTKILEDGVVNHLKFFNEFCHYERLTGGPDPHMRAVVYLCKDLPLVEKVWRAALYVGVYNVPSAEAIWTRFPTPPRPSELHAWVREHWDGIRFRRERKTVGLDPTHGDRFLDYCDGVDPTTDAAMSGEMHRMSFDELWRFAMRLPHVGRYAATKLCEIWYRLGLASAPVRDIRPKGGWSPRAGLNLIFGSDVASYDVHDDSPSALYFANERAGILKAMYPEMSYFELEVLLCEYKTSFSTKRQFPGRSLDSELAYERTVAEYWGERRTDHMRVRPLLSPVWALGEIQGWDPSERLKNLGRVLSAHGYTWSDGLYDYRATTDFSNPVKRGTP